MVAAVGGSGVILPAEYSLVVTAGKEAVERDLGSSITFLPDGSSSGVEISISDLRGNDAKLRVNWLTGLVDYAPHD
ncbi:hypothetical protein AOX55_00003075 [Sinorhizobium fredii CCBAU 25509]|nr:hypothetical protein AOX55_00003075 [Sinorhizobium fredii CCBAU 25509]